MKYQDTYQSEIFVKSQYLESESFVVKMFQHFLFLYGYRSIDIGNCIWQKEHRRVFIALVDDIEHLNKTFEKDFIASLTEHDTVITDNYIARPTLATVMQLPASWFGIYSYTPEIQYDPDRVFSFKTRRLDAIRMEIFLELHYRLHNFEDGYVSFDCASHDIDQTNENRVQAWKHIWEQCLPEDLKQKYKHSFSRLSNNVPLNNHNIEIDEAYQKSIINLVVETYSSEYTIALSEKIFRALVTPRLWAVYSGRYTVTYLRKLGFDVLDDIVDHDKYDTLAHDQHKVTEYIASVNPRFHSYDWKKLEKRCKQAAKHNQNLLAKFKQQWPLDFAHWLPTVLEKIQ